MIPLFYRFIQCLLFIIFKSWNRFEIIGTENIPKSGFILAANHVSYLDPPVLGAGIRRHVTFLAKEELFKVSWLGPVITWLGAMPVMGESDFRTLRAIIRSLKQGRIICIFPEGTRSNTGEISENFKSGVSFLAHTAKVPVVPCYLDGTDASWPRGGKSFRPAKIRVFLGRPFEIPDAVGAKDTHYEGFAQMIMDAIKALKVSATGVNP